MNVVPPRGFAENINSTSRIRLRHHFLHYFPHVLNMPLNSDLTAAETLVTLTRSTSSTSNSSNTQSGGASSVMSNLTSNSTDDSKVLQQSPEPIESDDLKTCFFPLQLHDIVSDEANADMIRWLPNGKAFVIADKKRFANEVLPKCFVQNSQFTSFTRKLTRWRFNRVPRGPLIGAYYHDLFVKDKRELVSRFTFFVFIFS